MNLYRITLKIFDKKYKMNVESNGPAYLLQDAVDQLLMDNMIKLEDYNLIKENTKPEEKSFYDRKVDAFWQGFFNGFNK